jgi:virginiamycin B lyase
MSGRSPAALAAALFGVVAPVAAYGQAAPLPDGDGRQMVEGVCTACHGINLVQNSSGYTREGWEELILTMIDLSGTPELETISAYLAAHFPENDRRKPVLMPGEVSIAFQEWRAPTLGQRTRDPVQAPDGSIWWAAQWSDLVGRVDPATGEIEEFPLPAGSRPHTVTADRDGNIWYTGNGNGTMGVLDPRTGEVTVYEMPDPAARDPHSAIVDDNGTVWFTLQHSNMVGRLTPANGEVELVTVPIEGARPYGIKLSAEGVPWVASNGSNNLFRIDPETMAVEAYPLPDPATTVRRLAFARDGAIWYVNSSQGRLGRLDPATGEATEWDSPSGPDSHPYAIAVIDDVIWYNESGQRPDALVRFDPATEEFQSWAIPSGKVHAGIVRHMRPTREGDLLIHQSSTNRVLLVELEGALADQ